MRRPFKGNVKKVIVLGGIGFLVHLPLCFASPKTTTLLTSSYHQVSDYFRIYVNIIIITLEFNLNIGLFSIFCAEYYDAFFYCTIKKNML